MFGLSKTFTLDARIEADTIPLRGTFHFPTRLMNDSRWPWIMVIPPYPDMVDVDELPFGGHEPFMQHLAHLSATLKAMGSATSTNVATLGNVVTQMHWHVVGRHEGDPNWPGPVWGFGERKPYKSEECEAFLKDFDAAWKKTVPLLSRLP